MNDNNDDKSWKSTESLEVRESGLSEFPKPSVDTSSRDQLPAGGGQWAVPPYQTTIGLINQVFRSYYHLYDNALKHSRSNAVQCRSDPIIEQAISEALTPISQLGWTVEPVDETNPAEVEAAKKVTLAINKTPRLQDMFISLLEACWYGRAGVEFTYKWDDYDPTLMVVKDWNPIPSDSLVPRWSGDWGVLVNAIYDGDTDPYSIGGRVHYYTPVEQEAILIHQFKKYPSDVYDALSTGSVAGIGWRHYVYWYWYIHSNVLANLLDLSERVGNGIWVSGFDQSNPTGRADMEASVAALREKKVLSIPQDKDGKSAYSLKILEPGQVSTNLLLEAMRYFAGVIRSVILGHPLSAGAEINVGGDPSAIYGDVISRSTKGRASGLAETCTYRWLPVLYRYIAPNVQPGIFRFQTEHPDADAILGFAERLGAMGWGVNLDEIAKLCGVSKASPDSQIYSKLQSLNPTAVTAPPQSIPIAGNQPAPQSTPAVNVQPQQPQ